MADSSKEENFLINIVEELDEDDNVKNFKLERISNRKDGPNEEYDLLTQKLQLDIEKQKKNEINNDIDEIVDGVKEDLDYKKGFLNSVESKNKSNKEKVTTEQQAKKITNLKYAEKKTESKVDKNEKPKDFFNSLADQIQIQLSKRETTKEAENSSSLFHFTPQKPPVKPKSTTEVNLNDRKYSSLFINPKHKKSTSNRKGNILNDDKKGVNRTKSTSRFVQNLADEKKIIFSTTKKNSSVGDINTQSASDFTREKNQYENQIQSKVSEDAGASAIKKNIENVNKEIYENMPLQIATEELYELHLDNDITEADCKDEELVLDFDEDYLYQRVFLWLKPGINEKEINQELENEPQKENSINKEHSKINNDGKEEIFIEGVDLNVHDDEEEEDFTLLEKPIIDEKILESVKDKLVYEIDNDAIEVINDMKEVDQTEFKKKLPEASSPIIKKSSLKSNCEEDRADSKKPKVNFSNIVTVKEIESKEQIKMQEFEEHDVSTVELEKIQEKLRLDKMYEDVFGDDYKIIQKQIIDNTKLFGFDSALDVEIPQSFREKEEKLRDEDEEVKFEDIVSNNVVERSIVSQDFEILVISKKEFGKSKHLMMTNDYIVARNTQKNKYL